MKRHVLPQIILWALLLSGFLLALELLCAPAAMQSSAAEPLPDPDLTIRTITFNPATPAVGQAVAIRIEITNIGVANAGEFTTTLYIDPPGVPGPSTPDDNSIVLPGLNAGRTTPWTITLNDGFATPGCGHTIYAWADYSNAVSEADEGNNLLSATLCVGMTPTPTLTPTPPPTSTPSPTLTPPPCATDTYEPDGNCGLAADISTGGAHQTHNLCPVGDEDWVKFMATANMTYTIATVNVGADGDTVLALYNVCNQPPLATSDPAFGDGAQLEWAAPAAGQYFLKVKHHSATYGPDAGYELFVLAASDCQGDSAEPDDTCATARDLAVGAPQPRTFCKPDDQDWVKFQADSGATYAISGTATGQLAEPIFALYDQCGYAAPLAQGQPITWTAPISGTYYVKAQNEDGEIYGPDAGYTLAVAMSQCAPDGFEGDNLPQQATSVLPIGADLLHDFCPAADVDWTKFQAMAGQLYVIETYDLEADADTRVCIFGNDGATQLACDDDGGGGLASRLRWTAPAAGDYYVRVENMAAGTSGPRTTYHLAISAGNPVDAHEPDNSAAQAHVITTDGTPQEHNFTPAGDQDWVKFTAEAGEPYVLRAQCLGGACDTVLHLIAPNGKTELAMNDDYGSGMQSQITYVFSEQDTYYLRVHHYRSNYSGHGTRYALSVMRNAQPPTATPTPTAPAPQGATATPPASGVKTLIVTNSERLQALYGGPTPAANIMNSLAALASHPRVVGTIIDTQSNAAALTAYALWNADDLSTTKANAVANAVRNVIQTYLNTNPSVEYIVIVGNDRVVPYRRFLDRTSYPESRYTLVTGGTSVWAACHDGMALTDDYYADREPSTVGGREIYVPDYAISRLPEGADQIVAFINTFLAGDQITLDRALVTGYDFVIDAGQQISNTLASDLGPAGTVNGALMNAWWQPGDLKELQLNTSPHFDLQSINGHASQHQEGAPAGGSVLDDDVLNYGTADLRRSLIFTVGCHSGFSDPAEPPAGLDLAQAFLARGANYVANTGYGWGSNAGIGWSEQLMLNFVRKLTAGSSVPIGKALMEAKRQYFQQATSFDAYDEKAMQESTLYGLPQYELVSGGLLGPEDPFPSIQITTSLPLATGPVRTSNLAINLLGSFGALDEHQTTDGVFYDINQGVQVATDLPMQPQFHANVTNLAAGRAHGILLRSAHYSDTLAIDPVVSRPVNEVVPPEDWLERPLTAEGWLPERPVDV
jgi:hypothetical protein